MDESCHIIDLKEQNSKPTSQLYYSISIIYSEKIKNKYIAEKVNDLIRL